MKRLELLIARARELSGNTRYDADSGVSQGVFVQYFQNAQDSLIKAIANSKCKYLQKTADPVQVTTGQEELAYPVDLFLRNIDTVEWNTSGNLSNEGWITLDKCIQKDRFSSTSGYPFGYVLNEEALIFAPPVQNGYVRLTYTRNRRNLQIRVGKITARTVAGGNISALTIDPSEASFNPTELNLYNYICVVNRDGERVAGPIDYDSVNAGTGVFAMSSQALDGTVTVGDYVVIGKFACNLPEWPDIVESYLIKHAVYEAKYGDSSQWTQAAIADVQKSQAELIESFSLMSDDVSQVPIINADFLDIC